MSDKHKTSRPDRSRALALDEALDEALRETFPASDPVALSVRGASLIATGKETAERQDD